MVERKSRRDVLRIDEGESGADGDGERECTKRGWVEGIISPMQIAFGLRLTEYTLELARCKFRPPYFPRESGRFRVCARALKKFHHREPQLVTSPFVRQSLRAILPLFEVFK